MFGHLVVSQNSSVEKENVVDLVLINTTEKRNYSRCMLWHFQVRAFRAVIIVHKYSRNTHYAAIMPLPWFNAYAPSCEAANRLFAPLCVLVWGFKGVQP